MLHSMLEISYDVTVVYVYVLNLSTIFHGILFSLSIFLDRANAQIMLTID